MRRRDRIIFQKIVSEADICMEMLGGTGIDEFVSDEKLKRACAMTVVNIGELVKNITKETREENKHIPWRAIAGMRDIVAHTYQTLRMEDVYNTIVTDLPKLKQELIKLLASDDGEE